MIPQHDWFYDVFSKAKKIRIRWPNQARLAVSLVGNLEAWTEVPDPKLRRTRHVGGSAPLTFSVSFGPFWSFLSLLCSSCPVPGYV